MITSLCFTPAAEIDLAATFAWYEEQRQGLGMKFIEAADALFSRIRESPRLFPEVVAGFGAGCSTAFRMASTSLSSRAV